MVRCLLAAAFAAAASLSAAAADTKFVLSGENTRLTFVGKKPDGKHNGGFSKLSGSATVADGDPTTLKAEVTIDTGSLHSDDAKLTAHLKSADFFDVKNHPKATFKVTKVAKADKGYSVTGELTMLGKTKPVSFPASIAATGGALQLSSSFPIDRTLWGMTYGKGKIEDKVDLKIAVAAKK
jgi:polyisoprenoid-binding protein YceI